MKINKTLLIAGLFVLNFARADEADWNWVQIAKGKSTNAVIRKDFVKFLDSELPDFKLDFGFERKNKKNSLREALLTVLGGPPDMTISPTDHSIVLSACRPQSCTEKGFYWADSLAKTSVMGVIHYVYDGKYDKGPQLFLASKHFKCTSMDTEALIQLRGWLAKESIKPSKVRCLEGNKIIEIQI
jgi:hypothetical protein